MNKYQYDSFITEENVEVYSKFEKTGFSISKELNKGDIFYLMRESNLFLGYSIEFYTINEIDAVCEEQNVRELQHINPLLFNSYGRNGMLAQFQDFFANTITMDQLRYCSYIMLSKLNYETLDTLINRFSDFYDKHYVFYNITEKMTGKRTIMFVGKEPVVSLLKKLREKKSRVVQRDVCIKNIFDSESVHLSNMLAYLDMDKASKYGKTAFSKLEPYNGKKTTYTVSSFLEMLRESYVPSVYDTRRTVRFPEEGLFKAEELLNEYNLNIKNIVNAARNKEIGCYMISDRILRFSKEDFNAYIENVVMAKNVSRNIVKRIPITTNEDYVEEPIILQQFSPRRETVGISVGPLAKILHKSCKSYYDASTGQTYFKKEEILQLLQQHYGYYRNNEFFPINNSIETNIEDIYNIGRATEYLKDKVAYNESTIRQYLTRLTRNGEVPSIKLSDRIILLRKEDVLTIKDKMNK